MNNNFKKKKNKKKKERNKRNLYPFRPPAGGISTPRRWYVQGGYPPHSKYLVEQGWWWGIAKRIEYKLGWKTHAAGLEVFENKHRRCNLPRASHEAFVTGARPHASYEVSVMGARHGSIARSFRDGCTHRTSHEGGARGVPLCRKSPYETNYCVNFAFDITWEEDYFITDAGWGGPPAFLMKYPEPLSLSRNATNQVYMKLV